MVCKNKNAHNGEMKNQFLVIKTKNYANAFYELITLAISTNESPETK